MSTVSQPARGFSLIELLVSIAIFSVVMTMAVGTLIVLLDANAKAQNIQTVMTNLTFALDSMTREIRTGSNYVCRTRTSPPSNPESDTAINDCSGGGNFVSIVESGTSQPNPSSLTDGLGSNRIEYFYDSDFYGSGHGAILRHLGDTGGASDGWFPITSEGVKIDSAEFYVSGTAKLSASDTLQPTVTVLITGTAGALADTDSTYTIQTTVTQRVLDI